MGLAAQGLEIKMYDEYLHTSDNNALTERPKFSAPKLNDCSS